MSKLLLKSCGIPGWFELYETLLASANSQMTNARCRKVKRPLTPNTHMVFTEGFRLECMTSWTSGVIAKFGYNG